MNRYHFTHDYKKSSIDWVVWPTEKWPCGCQVIYTRGEDSLYHSCSKATFNEPVRRQLDDIESAHALSLNITHFEYYERYINGPGQNPTVREAAAEFERRADATPLIRFAGHTEAQNMALHRLRVQGEIDDINRRSTE